MKTLITLALLAIPAIAQVKPSCNTAAIPVCSAPPLSGVNYTKAGAIPASITNVTVQDAYIKQIVLVGGFAAVTVTVTDGNGVSVLLAVSLAANSTYVIAFPEGYWCQGGFTIIASGTGATFQIKLQQ